MRSAKHEFLTGVICPISWDRRNVVKGYSIFTKEDEDVLLIGKNLPLTFLRFKNKNVTVSGRFLTSFSEARVFEVDKISSMGAAA